MAAGYVGIRPLAMARKRPAPVLCRQQPVQLRKTPDPSRNL